MAIAEEEAAVVVGAIRKYLPDVEISFFGSRVDGTAREGSDLDVLLKGAAEIDLGLISLVKEELEASDLPFRVDILDYHRCSGQMLKNIQGRAVRQGGGEVRKSPSS